MRARARIGLDAELGRGWAVGTRLTTGNLRDPVSTNQTLGNYGDRYQTDIDLAFANWMGTTRRASVIRGSSRAVACRTRGSHTTWCGIRTSPSKASRRAIGWASRAMDAAITSRS